MSMFASLIDENFSPVIISYILYIIIETSPTLVLFVFWNFSHKKNDIKLSIGFFIKHIRGCLFSCLWCPWQNRDRCHNFWRYYSIDVMKYSIPHLFSRGFLFPFPLPSYFSLKWRQYATCGDIYLHFAWALWTATFL